MARFFFAFLNFLNNATEFADVETNILPNLSHFSSQLFNFTNAAFHEHFPAAARFFVNVSQPVWIQLAPAIGINEFMTVDPSLVSQLHHRAVNRHDPAIDAVELVDQSFDPVVMQVQFIHQQHNFGTQFLIFGFRVVGESFIFVQSR